MCFAVPRVQTADMYITTWPLPQKTPHRCRSSGLHSLLSGKHTSDNTRWCWWQMEGCRQESSTGDWSRWQEAPGGSQNIEEWGEDGGEGGRRVKQEHYTSVQMTQHPIMDTEIIISQQLTTHQNFENVNFNLKKKKSSTKFLFNGWKCLIDGTNLTG